MKKIILTIFLTVPMLSFSQTNTIVYDEIYTTADTMPQFPGGNSELHLFILKHIKIHPDANIADNLKTIYLNFIVDKDGEIGNIKVIRGTNQKLDNEAIRVIKAMPLWIPGKRNGKNVNVSYNLPIRFELK